MMHLWFFIALIGPLLYAATNHIDKLLLSKYFKEGGVGTLMIFSSVSAAFAVPFLYLMDTSVFTVGWVYILALFINSVISVCVLWLYFIALQREEASIVVVFYQLVPVFGYLLGYFFLGEVLTVLQITAMALTILGAAIISFEIDADNHFKLRQKTVLLMTSAAFLWALESVIFKYVALEEKLWPSLFWEYLTLFIVGVCIFVFMRKYREHFLTVFKVNSASIVSLNFLNELLYIIGNIAYSYAYMLAPVALVLLAESYQPLFTLALGILLTVFFPWLSAEKVQLKNISQKVLAVVVTGIGTYLLFIS
jgi:drug/metabolite transporter (DMT)-like permease